MPGSYLRPGVPTRTGSRPSRRKALGQHHLRRGASARPLVDFLALTAGDRVLEIGAGGGELTLELARSGARVAAVELDLGWAVELRRRLREAAPQVTPVAIAVADALAIAWQRLPAGWKVAGNLPYSVGTAIVERFLRGAPAGTRAGFLLQREVVERMVAAPGDAAYGALSVLVAARARARRLGVLAPGAFVPPPKVESAFVGLERLPEELAAEDSRRFERVVRAAFARRRKTLRNALGAAFGREAAERALAGAAIAADRRAEELDLEAFRRLAGALTEG